MQMDPDGPIIRMTMQRRCCSILFAAVRLKAQRDTRGARQHCTTAFAVHARGNRGVCKALNLIWVTDSTNFSSEYARNYIRNVILPEMRHINPAVSKALLRLSQNALVHDPRSDILVSQYAGCHKSNCRKPI